MAMGARSRSGSYGSFGWVAGTTVKLEATISSVWPSGIAFAVASVPTMPLAAGRLSMTKGWPSDLSR